MDPWTIPPAERARHMEQFKSCNPVGGFVTGDQAKGFLLQSQLPPLVLGQIWSLADANCDGKMDINEFSVACKLITMKLKGFEVPPTLPPSLRMVLAGTGQTTPVLSPSASQHMMTSQPQVMMQPVMMMPGQVVPTSMMAMSGGMGVIAQPAGITSPPLVMPGQPVAFSSAPNAISMGVPMPGMVPAMPAIPPSSLAMGYVQSVQQPVMRSSQSQSSVQQLSRSASITSQDAVSSPLMEWAVPNPSRLKYTQMFNQNDRSKSGFLSGVQARNILMATGLPQQILATVWALSDLDSDGRLSCEEFILALHLCDVAKQTGRLPPKLPADLIPPSYRSGGSGSRRMSMKSASVAGSIGQVSGHNTGSNTPTFDEPLLSPGGTSFEDKRKQNFDKGQAELDRRRKLLEDMANREREERDRKEREEFEKREKQRLEIERRKQEEIERQLATQREMEERRMEELRKSEEQKEAARKEMERQRHSEMEETKRNELMARRQKEQDEVLRLKGVNNGLGLEVSQLTDKVKELSNKITDTRKGVSSVKSEIDGMRSKRDTFMNEMAMLKAQLKDQNNRMLHAAQEKVRLEKLASESDVKHINLKQLREKKDNVKEEFDKKQADSNAAKAELIELRASLSTLVDSCKTVYEEYRDKRDQLLVLRKKHQAEFDVNAAWGAASPREPTKLPPSPSSAVYYRALFDFESRNPDELSFFTGALIQKNEDIVPDPGWLAGTLGGRAGWFPESFVEILSDDYIPDSTAAPLSPPAAPAAVANNYGAETGGEYYVALYPYESHEQDDLPFEAGESIFVTHSEGEWWSGSIGDRSGIFPANYVAKHSEIAAEIESETKPVEQQEVNNYSTSMMTDFERSLLEGSKTELEPEEEAELKREISGFTKQAPPKSPKATGRKNKYEIGTILANYPGTGEGQLTLTKGQLITVRKKNSSGWWEGELQAKGKKREIGWFPGSYVKILGPGGGSRQSSSRTTPIPFDEAEMPVTVAPVYAETKEQMIALYPYTAQNSDELTFVKDDIIIILSKDEPDWWRGQLGSAIGLFPVNYVQPLSAADNQSSYFSFQNSNWDADVNDGLTPEGDGGDSVFGNEDDDWDDSFVGNGGDGSGSVGRNGSSGGSNGFAHQQQQPPSYEPYHVEKNVEFQPIAALPKPAVVLPMPILKQTTSTGHHSYTPAVVSANAGPMETQRQGSIRELIDTEQNYMGDMNIVKECFIVPLYNSGLLTHDELTAIFVNWEDLIDCSSKLLKAFAVRKRTCDNGTILMIGDILITHMPAMMTYIRFCSAQLRSASLIQQKSEKSAEFREFTKKCQSNPKTQNLPLSSFLIKPMQRITKYPLLIKKILEHTPEDHADRMNLEEALLRAEELCAQVNEGVREKENSDRLEWMQTHINCEGLEERLIFNSLTNALGPRKFLHYGILRKTKSGKELVGFLFNDFLLLAQPNRPLNESQFSFDRNKNLKFKIYRKPIFLNEITIKEESDSTANTENFTIEVHKKMYQLDVSALGISEKKLWLKNLQAATKNYHKVEQQHLQRQRSKKPNAVGRLLVAVLEANNLVDRSKCVRRRRPVGYIRVVVVEGIRLSNRDPNGKSDPYCEVSLGSDVKRTSILKQTLNPKWNDSMQFSVKDLHEDILCLTVYDKDMFSPDQFLGRMEIGISTIFEETRNRKTPWTKTFHLQEIESGDITVKLHLQIFDG